MAAKTRNGRTGSIRIIAGQWRGRRFPVADLPGLRPTTDRIRETLFNWLAPEIAGRYCLDLFAGSGALGLEALSRGAAHCTFVDVSPVVVRSLQGTVDDLAAQRRARVVQADALRFLDQDPIGEASTQVGAGADAGSSPAPFDLVFLDPPFTGDLLQRALDRLLAGDRLTRDALLYLEHAPQMVPLLPTGWTRWRSRQSGGVVYSLYRMD